MRIVGLRVQLDDLVFARRPVRRRRCCAGEIPRPAWPRTAGLVDGSPGPSSGAILPKRADPIRATIAIGILENPDPVGGRSNVVLGRKCVWLSIASTRPRSSTAMPVGVTISGSLANSSTLSRASIAWGTCWPAKGSASMLIRHKTSNIRIAPDSQGSSARDTARFVRPPRAPRSTQKSRPADARESSAVAKPEGIGGSDSGRSTATQGGTHVNRHLDDPSGGITRRRGSKSRKSSRQASW